MLSLIILFFVVILASAVCSMTEAALLSLPSIRARILLDEKRHGSKDLMFLKEHISMTIASIVIVNNAINIIGSIFIGQQIAKKFGDQWLGLASTVLTFTIIVCGEIIPKTIGERYKARVSLYTAKFVRVLVWILKPFVLFVTFVTRPFVLNKGLPGVTEDEIKMMLKLGRDSGTVEMDEAVLCDRVFRLNDLRAFQIMKPIDQIFALPADRTLGELREEIINSRFSRLAVFDKDPKDFVGMVQHRVLLREIAKDNYSAKLREFMAIPIFVNWFTRADELLEKFQVHHQHLFIVQDTHGKDVGLVTMEDVLEELFGEIYDEKDVKPKSHLNIEANAKGAEGMTNDFELRIRHPKDGDDFKIQ